MISRRLPPELARSRWRPSPAEKRQLRRERERFLKVRAAESWYIRQLRAVARHIGNLAEPFAENADPTSAAEFDRMMQRYAEILKPWAEVQAERLILDVMRRDAMAWFKIAREMGIELRELIENTPLGQEIRQLLDAQVNLITSLPIEAGRRVHEQVLTGQWTGERYGRLIPAIRESLISTGGNAQARATLIARTETARASSVITTARAKYVGVTHFVWHTVNDADVRPLHRSFDGKIYSYDNLPILDDGQPGLPGTIWNCRCFQEPLVSPPEA